MLMLFAGFLLRELPLAADSAGGGSHDTGPRRESSAPLTDAMHANDDPDQRSRIAWMHRRKSNQPRR
ncbi:MAG: hypothetical protein BGP24_16715 [Lysobacterales bacterium 69-70]|nr:MAG: hypothetical protein ABT27_03460 [Xanthomonadaceae bacterium SCN 69-25]OJZ02868.1 MAG: hypothetical protein BGP24_16715 [Xanthomonadales bacterium 69-70]